MNINYDFFKKKNMKGFMLNQFLPATLIIVVGMYLVKTYLEACNGSIEIGESELGGARFSIYIPRTESNR